MSRKYLSLIHLFARELAARVYMTKAVVKLLTSSRAHAPGSILNEPFAESIVQGPVLAASNFAGAFNGSFVGAKGDVLHTIIVYTSTSAHVQQCILIREAELDSNRNSLYHSARTLPCPPSISKFQESARKFPDIIALEIQRQQTVERVTFAELTRMSESVANWLSSRVPRDARIAILAANHPRWVAAYLGIIAAGRTAVPLDTAFHADQVKKLLIDSGASLLFCDVKHLPDRDRSRCGTQRRAGDDFRGSRATRRAARRAREIPVRDQSPISIPSSPRAPAGFQPVAPAEGDLAALLYTSGTTADPKGVMLTHANLLGEANSVLASSKSVPKTRFSGFFLCSTSWRRWRTYSCHFSTARASCTSKL